VDLDRLSVVAVAAVHAGDRHRAARAAARLGAELSGLGGEHEGRLVVLAGDDGASRDPRAVGHQLQSALAGAESEATVGVDALTHPADPTALVEAWRRACTCVDTLQTLGRAGEVSDPTGLGVARLLLGRTGAEELDAYLERTLGPVIAYDAQRGTDLVPTLQAWFDAGGRAGRAAEALHVHPNTVAQRLERVGELLGPDWREPSAALEQHVALRLWQLRRSG
jgi:hypothetical protein